MVSELSGSMAETSQAMAIPPPVSGSIAINQPAAVVHNFSIPISIKLDEENYFPWKDQAEASIEAHELVDFINGVNVPTQFQSEEDKRNGIVTAEFKI